MFDQFYYTHCTAESSVLGDNGYSIRAASLSASEIRELGLQAYLSDYAYYELPIGLRTRGREGTLRIEEAPVRLARLPGKDGKIVIVHSVFRPADTIGRPLNHFAHVILPREGDETLSAAEALALWAKEGSWGSAGDWIWRESVSGPLETQSLPTWEPTGAVEDAFLSPQSLGAFIRGEQVRTPVDKPTLEVTPSRLSGDANKSLRREIFASVLCTYLQGKRVYLIAEHGFAALLSYGLTCMLPPELVESLTFSTYERPDRCKKCGADVVNTVPDTQGDVEGSLSSVVEDGVILNTFRFALPDTVAGDEVYWAYAQHALDQIENEEHENLSELWAGWGNLYENEALNIDRFRDSWQQRQRLSSIQTLTDEELNGNFLEPARWRPELFATQDGLRRAVQIAMNKSKPVWWPTNADDPNFQYFRPWLQDFRTLLIDRIVNVLHAATDSDREAYRVRNWIDELLPGLCDDEFTEKVAAGQITEALSGGTDDEGSTEPLAWTSRLLVIQFLSRCDLLTHDADWLNGLTADQLDDLCREVSDDVKVDAILAALEGGESPSSKFGEVLVDNHKCLNNVVAESIASDPENKMWPSRLLAVFREMKFSIKKLNLMFALLRLDAFDAIDVSTFFASLLNDLLSSAKKHRFLKSCCRSFFDKGQRSSWLVKRIGSNDETMGVFWAECCNCLDLTCLSPDGESRLVLAGLTKHANAGQLNLPDEAQRDRFMNWKRLAEGLNEHPPANRVEWENLRHAIVCLDLAESRIDVLARLIETVVGQGDVDESTIVEIAEFARSMTPPPQELIELAMVVIEACGKSEHGQVIESRLLREVCRENIAGCEEVLIELDDDRLSKDGRSDLEAYHDQLVEQIASRRGTNQRRYLELAFVYGPPTGMCVVMLVAVALVAASGFTGWKSGLLVTFFVVCASAIAFTQAYFIEQLRAERSIGIGKRFSRKTSADRKSRKNRSQSSAERTSADVR